MPKLSMLASRLVALAALTAGMIAALAGAAHAEKRVALVIGNSSYVHASELKNPSNDANAIAEKLSALDFQVIKGVDLDQNGMRSKVQEFARSINDAQVALLFYAGHGLQVDGQNYLLPINAELNNEIDLQFQGVAVDFLLRVMENRNRTSIVLLDACRNNPLAARLARSMNSGRAATVNQGLARIETGVGTYIGFSTSPDSVALDGDGDNSPFTNALLKHIDTENEDIESVMRNVREDVIKRTNGSQVPWGNSSLVGRGFVFKASAEKETRKVASAAPAQTQSTDSNLTAILQNLANQSATRSSGEDRQIELTYWESIQNSTDPLFFKAYLEQFPDGSFSSLARLKISLLEAKQNAGKQESAKSEPAPKVEAPKKAEVSKPEPAAEKQEELKVASLPESRALTVEEEEPAPPSRETLRSLQSELNRVGCSVGGVDGIWGRKSQAALEDFAKRRELKLASIEPGVDILDTLRSVDDRVCPLVCGRGFVKNGDSCERVVVTKPRTKTVKRTTVRRKTVAPQIFVQPRPRIGNTLNNIHQSNRHMPPGVDSDGGQM